VFQDRKAKALITALKKHTKKHKTQNTHTKGSLAGK